MMLGGKGHLYEPTTELMDVMKPKKENDAFPHELRCSPHVLRLENAPGLSSSRQSQLCVGREQISQFMIVFYIEMTT